MIFESLLLNFTILLALIIALTFDYVTKFFSYWYIRHVPYKIPVPFFGSDYHRVLGFRSNTEEINCLYRKYSDGLVGSIKSRIPDLTVKDPDLIKKVLSTEFESFQSRGIDLCRSQDVCLRNNLFYSDCEKWSLLRGGLESILQSMNCDDCSFECLSGINGDTIVQEMLSEVLDAVFEQILFGGNGHTIKGLRSSLQNRTFLDRLKSYLKNIFPSIYTVFRLETLPSHASKVTVEKIKHSNLTKKIETSFLFDKDDNKNLKQGPDALAFGVLASFVCEGYLPCRDVLTALLFELSKNNEAQTKARNSKNYLELVIKETLRLHPPYSVITRKCTKMYKFPGINDDKVVIDRGVTVNIPIEALHRDSKYYEEANKFVPERFINDASINSYAYLPFGAGPRKCVGERLSLQILRTVSSNVLKRFNIEPTEKTPQDLSMVDFNFGRVIDKEIQLKFIPRD